MLVLVKFNFLGCFVRKTLNTLLVSLVVVNEEVRGSFLPPEPSGSKVLQHEVPSGILEE